jgi:hypothetical protein
MLETEERGGAARKREAMREIFSKAFIARAMLCAIATASLIISVLNFAVVQYHHRPNKYENKDYRRSIELAYERLTNDDARAEWARLSGLVGSAAFIQSYYLMFFGALICK